MTRIIYFQRIKEAISKNNFITNITITMYSISIVTIRQYLFNINIHYASYIYEFMMLSHYPATQVLVFFNKHHKITFLYEEVTLVIFKRMFLKKKLEKSFCCIV